MQEAETAEVFGFLSISGSLDAGMIGGLLLLNQRGRPLEFHCTSPVRPNRAQTILYGATLREYVVGEQIAPALLRKAKRSPTFLWTDDSHGLQGRPGLDCPTALLAAAPTETSYKVRPNQFACLHEKFPADLDQLKKTLPLLDERLDLNEPFERIQDAIAEAFKKKTAAAA